MADTAEQLGLDFPVPFDAAAKARLDRWLGGEVDLGLLTGDDLAQIAILPRPERRRAVAALLRGIESAVVDGLAAIGETARPTLVSLVAPPMLAKDEAARFLDPHEGLIVLVKIEREVALAVAWRPAKGAVRFRTRFAELPSDDSRDESVLATEVAEVTEQFVADGVTRVLLAGRLRDQSLASLRSSLSTEARLVDLPGLDHVVRGSSARPKPKLTLVLMDYNAERNLPSIVVAGGTLASVGFEIRQPGAGLDTETALALRDARGVVLAGHGHGAMGPLSSFVGGIETHHLQSLPLDGADWAVCLACAAGDSRVPTDLLWDRDNPAGAAESLLIAGSAAAADCLTPVPEVVAAVVLETFGVEVAAGAEPERAFAEAMRWWRRAFLSMEETLSERFVDKAPSASDEIALTVVGEIDRMPASSTRARSRPHAAVELDGAARAAAHRRRASR